jgi:hypothetical protein
MKMRGVRIGLMVLPLLILLGLAVYAALIAWNMAGDTPIGGHGVIAMVLGVIFSIALTGVLVGLLLYSRRHGYDQ